MAWALAALAGCEDFAVTEEGRAGCADVPASVSEGEATMLPGSACMTCHRAFTAAGTVFARAASACDGARASGARVELLDRAGRVAVTMTTNAAGNFYTRQAIPSPYTARVTAADGTTRTMSTPQTNGSCAHCHRLPSVEGTTGRVATADDAVDGGAVDAD